MLCGSCIQLKKQFKIQIIGILEEKDSFYWPKMHLWKGDKKFGQGPPPPSFGQNPKVKQFFSGEIVSYIIMDYFLIRSWSLSSFAKVLSLGWCGHGGISFRESWKEFNLAFLRVIILGTRAPHPPPSVKMNRIKCLPDIFPFYFFHHEVL